MRSVAHRSLLTRFKRKVKAVKAVHRIQPQTTTTRAIPNRICVHSHITISCFSAPAPAMQPKRLSCRRTGFKGLLRYRWRWCCCWCCPRCLVRRLNEHIFLKFHLDWSDAQMPVNQWRCSSYSMQHLNFEHNERQWGGSCDMMRLLMSLHVIFSWRRKPLWHIYER